MIHTIISRLLCVAALFTAGVADAGPTGMSDNARPNILLIVSEDNGPELGCYGDPYAKTPRLDRLAADGIRFERANVPQAGCSQSRASLFTGLYPHQHGQFGMANLSIRCKVEHTMISPRLPAQVFRAMVTPIADLISKIMWLGGAWNTERTF